MTFRHWAGVSSYTLAFALAETCVFDKQALGPLHCGQLSLAPLLPKLRGHFAEFLNKGSPVRLRILSSPTCVGFRYGHHQNILSSFSRQRELTRFPTIFRSTSHLTLKPRVLHYKASLVLVQGLTIALLELSFCVTASFLMVVQESTPAVHRLRLPSSA